ncbi:MAG: hypothetical protein ACTTJ6_02690 [Treponema sp.]
MKNLFKKHSETKIVFNPSSFFLRAMNLVCAVFILASNVIGLKTDTYSFVAIAIAIFLIMIACYHNIWVFYIDKRIVQNKKGVLFFNKKQQYKFSEVYSILIDKYNRMGRSAEYTEISIQFKDGEIQTIENDKTKRLEKDISLAKELQMLINPNDE